MFKKRITHDEAVSIPRQLNSANHCGQWVAMPQLSQLTCEGRLFSNNVKVNVVKARSGWSVSIVRRPRQWNDPLSVEPFVQVAGDDPVECYKQAVKEARAHLELKDQ